MVRVAAYVPNLMDRSRFPDQTTFISNASNLSDLEVDLVIVDLARCENLVDFVQKDVETIGFGPHVDSKLAAEAVAAGYTDVLTRSVFFNRLETLLS